MAHLSHDSAPPVAEKFNLKDAGGLPTIFLGAAGIGLLGSLIGFVFWRGPVSPPSLFSPFSFFPLCAGSLFWTILHHATDAEWSVVVRRQLENTASLLWIFFLLLAPLILWCAPILWKWWDIAPGVDALLDQKAGYLNHTFFIVRY